MTEVKQAAAHADKLLTQKANAELIIARISFMTSYYTQHGIDPVGTPYDEALKKAGVL